MRNWRGCSSWTELQGLGDPPRKSADRSANTLLKKRAAHGEASNVLGIAKSRGQQFT